MKDPDPDYGFDAYHRTPEGRELAAVYSDYGHDIYNDDLIEPVSLPARGNCFYVRDPVLLVKIAANLSRFAELKAADAVPERALGWTTGLTTILIGIRDLKESTLRYAGDGEKDEHGRSVRVTMPELLERANTIASVKFREEFGRSWPELARQHKFITEDW